MASLESAIQHLLAAKRISAPSQSYRKDNPVEYQKVQAYLTGGPRPSGVATEMGLGLVEVEDVRRGVIPPVGDKLRYAPPTLFNPVQITLTNANRSSALADGQGRDASVKVGEVLNGSVRIQNWRNVVWIGGEFQTSGNPTSSGTIIPQTNSGTLHFEGIKAKVAGDFFGARFTNPIVQIQNCDIQVSDEGTTAHADCFQTQYLTCDELRCDKGTFRTDYQGFFISNEPKLPEQPLPSQVKKFTLSRWNFQPGSRGFPATWMFKAIPSRTSIALGPWELSDVWIPDDNPTMRVYPSSSGIDWAGNPMPTKCSRVGNTVVWTADAGISGVVNIGQHEDFCASDAGMGYVSPGYL